MRTIQPESQESAPPGIDVSRLSAWLTTGLAGSVPPFDFHLIGGGHSNLTYEVTDATGAQWVLRRPPLGPLSPTAHDMAREYRIITALAPTAVPVPPAVALCTDPSVSGAPFYVMGLVDGHVLRDDNVAVSVFDVDARRRAGYALIHTLADLHEVVPSEVGLADLSRPGSYIDRQLHRWSSQLEQLSTVRDVSALVAIHQKLAVRVPPQAEVRIVHGDFRLDNCIFGGDSTVRAALDWELCTLGDPLADVGLLMVYWTDPDDDAPAMRGAPTAAGGFPRRADALQRYATISGRDVSDIGFYTAFSYWRLACIIEGVSARYERGAMGGCTADVAAFRDQIDRLIHAARRVEAELRS